jgi:hypothetical protein
MPDCGRHSLSFPRNIRASLAKVLVSDGFGLTRIALPAPRVAH